MDAREAELIYLAGKEAVIQVCPGSTASGIFRVENKLPEDRLEPIVTLQALSCRVCSGSMASNAVKAKPYGR